MRAPVELHRDLVLVGGGHSHVLALRSLAMWPVAGLRITLVSPSSHTPYSGMLPGLIAGHYRFEETHIDLARLCQWAGARFIAAEVTALDPSARRLRLAGREPLDYDLVSIDVGSLPELDSVPGARRHATPVKPVAGLWQRWQALEDRIGGHGGAGCRVAVVGGGAGGVELALAMAHRLRARNVQLSLWSGTTQILEGFNCHARRAALAALRRYDVAVNTGVRVNEVSAGELLLADDSRHAFEELFWCTGASPAPWVSASGLPTDQLGFLAVSDTLQSTGDLRVFGAGDIATQIAHPRPKAGVHAVRQAPVLAHNLRAALLAQPLRRHRPQRRFLSLLSLGERRAATSRGVLGASGAWAWRWKDRIDRRFMARFRELPAQMPARVPQHLPQLPARAQPACGGCGAKVGADPLAEVLAQLAARFPRHCEVEADDAVLLRDAGGAGVLQSLDILREMVGDPWLMGRIAAGHAMSDLYACGARPVSALAAVTVPYAAPPIQRRDLYQLLSGALHEFAAVDCRLAGGHSMQGAELAVGFAVSGLPVDPGGRLLRKRGARPGDALVLTRPLGTGLLFAAHMQLAADGRDIETAVAGMLSGNRTAAELALAHGVRAATDITGFGLLGHLLEMLHDGVGARLTLSRLPLLPGVAELLHRGFASTMLPANSAAARHLAVDGAVDTDVAQILFDPQTAGGLLLALPRPAADALLAALHAADCPQAAIVGAVVGGAAEDGPPRVSLDA